MPEYNEQTLLIIKAISEKFKLTNAFKDYQEVLAQKEGCAKVLIELAKLAKCPDLDKAKCAGTKTMELCMKNLAKKDKACMPKHIEASEKEVNLMVARLYHGTTKMASFSLSR